MLGFKAKRTNLHETYDYPKQPAVLGAPSGDADECNPATPLLGTLDGEAGMRVKLHRKHEAPGRGGFASACRAQSFLGSACQSAG